MGGQKMMQHLRGNWGAKVLSLLAAIIMWFFIMRSQNPMIEVTYTVPVQIQNLNPQYVLDNVPKDIRVTMSGPRDTVLNLHQEGLKAYIDASNITPGQDNVNILFTAPQGMTIIDMKPESVTITVDEYAEKVMSVEIVPVGKLSDDVAINSVNIIPKQVTVTGRKQLIDKLSRVIMKVNVAGQTKNFSSVGNLEAWDAAGNVLDLVVTPAQAQAQYELNLMRKEKAVPIDVPTVGTVANGFAVRNVSVTPAQVTILGREEAIDAVMAIQTQPINVDNVTGTIEGTYNLVLPNGVITTTQTVHVKVEIQKI